MSEKTPIDDLDDKLCELINSFSKAGLDVYMIIGLLDCIKTRIKNYCESQQEDDEDDEEDKPWL